MYQLMTMLWSQMYAVLVYPGVHAWLSQQMALVYIHTCDTFISSYMDGSVM